MYDLSLDISPVLRSKRDAKRYYDRISIYYDFIVGPFERKYSQQALKMLSIDRGETVLEIGIGTGHCLNSVAGLVGKAGIVCGIDISPGMLAITKKRLDKARQEGNTSLCCGDASRLPFGSAIFDAVFISFTLELFDTPEIAVVLREIKRVLNPGGRLGVVSMSRAGGRTAPVRLYEWAHRRWPKYMDCRPIYVEASIGNAGYVVRKRRKASLFGLPLEIVVAGKL
jgi:demethylmenaquinone methyltransferase/2-methoxy-6-polyprenyl-1,4-benzoquinol methylase